MNKNRYLIIADKPYITNEIRKVYEEMKDDLQFAADFASANCHVVDAFNTCPLTAVGKVLNLVDGDSWTDEDGNVGVVEEFELKHVKVGKQYRVIRDGTYGKNMSENILELVKNNNYDAIVNACDSAVEGNLRFWYTIESIGLDKHETKRMYLLGFCLNNLEDELLLLNKN